MMGKRLPGERGRERVNGREWTGESGRQEGGGGGERGMKFGRQD